MKRTACLVWWVLPRALEALIVCSVRRNDSAFPGYLIIAGLIVALCEPLQAQLSDVTQPGDPIISTSSNSLGGGDGFWNAIDNDPTTRYINFEKFNTGFTVYPRVGLSVVSGLTLTSAYGPPENDPASYVLFGSYDSTNLTQISSGNVAPFTSRLQTQTILFDNKVPYLLYKLIFPTLSNAAAANFMQIAEVELLGVPGPHDVTSPGDLIVATSNNSPGSDGVANAIDDQPTKYRNFDKLNAGFTVTPGRGTTIVVGLTLTSGNDGAERDPSSYTLAGSHDGTNFLAISSGSVPPFPTRFHKHLFVFPEHTNSFTSYRLIFPTVVNPATANSMDIGEVELLAHLFQPLGPCPCSTNSAPLISKQPADTPVLLGAHAFFRVGLTGPWRLQWYLNDFEIPGATLATYITPPVTAADDGTRYRARVTGPSCYTDSDEVLLNVFAPSPTESIGLNFTGDSGATGPFVMLPWDITGLHPQAYWNNIRQAGSLPNPLNSSNQPHPTITVQWATPGEWRAGVGEDDATQRMFEGLATCVATNEAAAQTVTFSNVPPGNHSVLLYTVQVPLEFFSMDFQAVIFGTDGTPRTTQQRFIRPQNGDEYNASPGFHLVTSDTPATRAVGNTLRFENLQPEDGRIQIRFFSPDRTQPPPPANPVRGPGLNGLQLLLCPGGERTRVASVIYSGNSASVSFATSNGLIYTVEYTEDLNEPVTWTPLLPVVTGTGSPATLVDSSPDPFMRLYRVRVE